MNLEDMFPIPEEVVWEMSLPDDERPTFEDNPDWSEDNPDWSEDDEN